VALSLQDLQPLWYDLAGNPRAGGSASRHTATVRHITDLITPQTLAGWERGAG
jgi:hypothetical protein